ncbi:PTS glucose transporter subunit IIA [Lactiplantibacillus paraplantarum]|uniref:PTS sugar transporter subunit IIA n=1 Tax=Lactiplantibacillus paraplantarum TaxID=60520 RepID=UPI0021A91E24|nr:PTS glucose transporter subunit IIA [Lactiplantibacillus paraplantarum]MCT4457470.1 PTS glucose transporter subunit IIA [Lactiplantibacillus paraplantarum]
MFGIKRKKVDVFEVLTPIEGICIPITDVADEVFAKKMMGDGFAIRPSEAANQVVAPISGKIIALPESKHAIGIMDETRRIAVLVHIGLDTVSLNGKGFTAHVELNQEVQAGSLLVTIDRQMMATAGLDMTTMVVFTEGYTGEVPLGSKLHQQLAAATPVLKQA